MLRSAVVCVLVLLCNSVVEAQVRPDTPVVVIDLFAKPRRALVVRASTINEVLAVKEGASHTAAPLERLLDACKAPVQESVRPLILKLQDCVQCLAAFQERRFITERGDLVVLLVLFHEDEFAADEIRPYFVETPRDSELVATAKALRGLFAPEADGLSCEAFTYTLQRARSRFRVVLPLPVRESVTAVQPPPSTAAVPSSALVTTIATPSQATPSAAEEVQSPEITLGPSERWFLSADFSFSAAALEFGKDPVPGTEELKSKDFFVSLNLSFSDLLVDRDSRLQERRFLDELVAKLQVTPSRRPWEGWALGLGLRGYKIRTVIWNMDIVHPYVVVGRQRNEDGAVSWRVSAGLGFDPRAINRQK